MEKIRRWGLPGIGVLVVVLFWAVLRPGGAPPTQPQGVAPTAVEGAPAPQQPNADAGGSGQAKEPPSVGEPADLILVRAEDSSAIEGAEVWRLSDEESMAAWLGGLKDASGPSLRSNARGAVRFPDPAAPWQSSGLLLRAEGRAEALLPVPASRKVPAEIRIPAARRVWGQVLHADRSPAPGASVVALSHPEQEPGSELFFAHATVADSEGRFEMLRGASGVSYRVFARKEGFQAGWGEFPADAAMGLDVLLGEKGVRVSGVVKDSEGATLEGMMVWALPEEGQGLLEHTMMAMTSHVQSDAAGSWTIEGVKPGRVTFLASGSRGFPSTARVVQVAQSKPPFVELRFPKGTEVTFRFQEGGSGKGVAGVGVAPAFVGRFTKETPLFFSGADGVVRVIVPQAAGPFGGSMPCMVGVKPPEGYLVDSDMVSGEMMILQGLKPNEPAERTIILRKGFPLEVAVVLASSGAAVPKCSVRLDATVPFATAETDMGGVARFLVLPGTYAASATAKVGWGRASLEVDAHGRPARQELRLAPFASVAGRVVDDEGKPVAEAIVKYKIQQHGIMAVMDQGKGVRTGADGQFKVGSLAGSALVVWAESPFGTGGPASDRVEVAFAPGEKKQGLELVLTEGTERRIRVQDEAGKPIEGVKGTWTLSRGENLEDALFAAPETGVTDAAGVLVVRRLTEQRSARKIKLTKDGYIPARVEELRALDDDPVLVLQGQPSVTLRVVGPNEEAIADFTYLLQQEGGRSHASFARPQSVTNGAAGVPLELESTGAFTIEVEEHGAHGEPGGRRGRVQFQAPPVGTPREVLVRLSGGATLRGRVVDSSGAPAAEARVAEMFERMIGTLGFAKTDADGSFRLPGALAGDYRLMATLGERVSDQVRVVVGEDLADPAEVTLVLGEICGVEGTLTDRSGTPMGGSTIAVMTSNRGELTTQTDGKGRYRLAGLPPGNTMVSVMLPAFESKSVELAAGKITQIDFDFSKYVEISGAVNLNGESVSGSMLSFREVETGAGRSLFVEGGRYNGLVPSGRHEVTLTAGMRESLVGPVVEVPPTPRSQTHDLGFGTVPVDLALVPPEGLTVVQGSVSLESESGRDEAPNFSFHDISGTRKRIPHVVPGRYRARFQDPAGSLEGESEWQEVGVGKENVLVLVLRDVSAERQRVARAQEQLRQFGHDPGPADGLLGRRTSEALRAFQQAQGLLVSGSLDEATAARLEALAPTAAPTPAGT